MSNVNPFYSVFQAKDSPWNQHFQDSELKRIIEQEKSGIIFVLIRQQQQQQHVLYRDTATFKR